MTEKKSNGLAIASFVLAIGGVLFLRLLGGLAWLCVLLALIFGIIALKKKQLKWAALSGIIISSIFILVIPILLIIPRLNNAQGNARDISRINEINQIMTAIVFANIDGNMINGEGCTTDLKSILVPKYLSNMYNDPSNQQIINGCSSYYYKVDQGNIAIIAKMEGLRGNATGIILKENNIDNIKNSITKGICENKEDCFYVVTY